MVDFEHGYIQRAYNEYYASGQTVPQNTNADGDDGPRQNSGAMGGISITAVAKTDVAIADTKTLTITVLDCDSETGSYVEIGKICVLLSSGATTYEAGTVLGQFILPPSARSWTKINIATDDATATGTIDVFAEMIPR
jgi:hypothetical protein